MPTSYVAAEKVLFAVLRSLIATLIMIPVGILILGSIPGAGTTSRSSSSRWCWERSSAPASAC
jgi:hypothetical protein